MQSPFYHHTLVLLSNENKSNVHINALRLWHCFPPLTRELKSANCGVCARGTNKWGQ